MNEFGKLGVATIMSLLPFAFVAADEDDQLPVLVIPSGKEAHIADELLPSVRDFNHATLSGIWTGQTTEPALEESMAAFAMIEDAWGKYWSGNDPEFRTSNFITLIDKALAAGSNDAMVLYLDAQFRRRPLAQRLERFRAAYTALSGSPYPVIRKYYCASQIIQCLLRMDPRNEKDLAAARIIAETDLIASLRTLAPDDYGSCPGIDQPARELLDSSAFLKIPGMCTHVLADLQDPKVPRWWSHYLTGIVQIRLAWMARGNGWASSVTPDGWRDFYLHLPQARQNLVAAWKLFPNRPEPAVQMIFVAMGGDREDGDEQTWFERAVAGRIDVISAYTNLSTSWTPRWAGSYKKMLMIGEVAAATKRYDTDVPWQYINQVRAIWTDANSLNHPRPVILNQKIFDHCKEVADAYTAAKHRAPNAHAISLAVIAWMCGLPQETLHQLDLADPHANRVDLYILNVTTPAQLRKLVNDAATVVAPPPIPAVPPDSPMGGPDDPTM